MLFHWHELSLTLTVHSHILLILSTLKISHICLLAFLHTSAIEKGMSYGQNNVAEIGRKCYFCLCYGCSIWICMHLPCSQPLSLFHGYFLSFSCYFTLHLFFILFLCEWTTSGLPAPLFCLRYCFHIYPGILEKLIYYRKLSGSMLLVFKAYLLPLPFCCHSLNKLLQNIFENKGTKLH